MQPSEAIEKIILDNDGCATLGHIIQQIQFFPLGDWKYESLIKTVPTIVKEDEFFEIRQNLFGLKAGEQQILKKLNLKSEKMQDSFDHSYYQGLIIEIGQFKGLETYVNKKNAKRKFLFEHLEDMTDIDEIYPFSYDHILEAIKDIDISWWNRRHFPASVFEVEFGKRFEHSLDKFLHLQDLNLSFYIVADRKKRPDFDEAIIDSRYHSIEGRVKFADYRYIETIHTKSFEYAATHNDD